MVDDAVLVKSLKYAKGIVKAYSSTNVYYPGLYYHQPKIEYGVEVEGYLGMGYYSEEDLVKDEGRTNPPLNCTCGARKAHFPNNPPGHASHCDESRKPI